jgi:hypothetical protein
LTAQRGKKYNIASHIKIVRNIGSGTFSFNEIFLGFEKLAAVREIFGEKTDEMLANLKVEVFPRQGYMGVSDEDGHIFASQYYINKGELWSVYLDTIHELVHVRQFMEGKNLFDPAYSYVDRPTEIEAYQIGTLEARRIGLSEGEILEYLKVPWITRAQHVRLAESCGILADEDGGLVRKERKTSVTNKKKK